jgi:ribonuclease HII
VGARLPGLNDSKQMRPAERERVAALIQRHALAWAIGAADHQVIDQLGLTRARQIAMGAAVRQLTVQVEYLLIDAWDVPDLPLPQMAVVKGDSICASIMAASVLAKVDRDRTMIEFDRLHPGYGFAGHKGYATVAHRQALRELGPSPIHRRSWAPLRALKTEQQEKAREEQLAAGVS